jgi:hypothetical protein
MLGLPPITNEAAFKATLALGHNDELSYDHFVKIMQMKSEKQ